MRIEQIKTKEVKYLEGYSDKVWQTKKARFAASQRMKYCYNTFNICIAISSVGIIAVNVLSFSKRFSDKIEDIAIATIILSIFYLVLSLLSSQAEFSKKEDNYHYCGCDLSELNDKMQYYIKGLDRLTPEKVNEFIEEYNQIIKRYNLNHSSLDFDWAMKDENSKSDKKIVLWIRWYIWNCRALILLIMVMMFAFLYFLLFYEKDIPCILL